MTHDPVCNMTVIVNEGSEVETTEYKGITYYFCAAGCRETFEKEPEKYVAGLAGDEHSHS